MRCDQGATLLLRHIAPHHHIGVAGFIFQRHEGDAARRPRPLPTRHQARHTNPSPRRNPPEIARPIDTGELRPNQSHRMGAGVSRSSRSPPAPPVRASLVATRWLIAVLQLRRSAPTANQAPQRHQSSTACNRSDARPAHATHRRVPAFASPDPAPPAPPDRERCETAFAALATSMRRPAASFKPPTRCNPNRIIGCSGRRSEPMSSSQLDSAGAGGGKTRCVSHVLCIHQSVVRSPRCAGRPESTATASRSPSVDCSARRRRTLPGEL